MEVKILELRDDATFIPVMAVSGDPFDVSDEAGYLLMRAGWASEPFVYLISLNDARCQWDPFKWNNCRTFTTAHRYIRDHWNDLNDGDVVDVQFILGETNKPKASERYDDPADFVTQEAI